MVYLKDITSVSERLDHKIANVNCAGCRFKEGKKCTHHNAFLQSNPHRPTDCKHWERKDD